jgi:hypothetical protein
MLTSWVRTAPPMITVAGRHVLAGAILKAI